MFTHAYRRPRELTWLTGIALLGLMLGFGFSGYLLPWNQISYFATKVGTDVAGSTPVVGPVIARFLRGGEDVGAATLTRFFDLPRDHSAADHAAGWLGCICYWCRSRHEHAQRASPRRRTGTHEVLPELLSAGTDGLVRRAGRCWGRWRPSSPGNSVRRPTLSPPPPRAFARNGISWRSSTR